MRTSDLCRVKALSEIIHVNYPERLVIFAEKLRLFPEGCFVLTAADVVDGYCFSHPWTGGVPPKLDSLLYSLPKPPTTYFIHDIALIESRRRKGFAGMLLGQLDSVARELAFNLLTLVSVNGTESYWLSQGFQEWDVDGSHDYLEAEYGAGAVLMCRPVLSGPKIVIK